MAIRTCNATGNWSDPNTWVEGEVPTASDDVVWQSGDLTIDTSDAICKTINLEEYSTYLNFVNGSVLTVVEQMYLALSSGLILANPVDKIIFQSSTVSVWYDGERSVAVFDNGVGIYIIAYV